MQKFLKKLLFIFSIVFCGNIFLVNFSFVEAGNPVTSNDKIQVQKQTQDKAKQQEDLAEKVKAFQTFGQALYTITWPLIVIGGKFMDNNVVYGSFIGMDSLLWQIWNVMRTFANYIIGFILIFSIFTLFLGGKLEQFNPIKIIPQLAIAAVLVNASWFLVGAMIDVSNVMTYAVGTLPLQMANKKTVGDQVVPKFGMKLQDNGANAFQVGIMDGKTLLPFCEYKPSTNGDLIAKSNCAFEYKGKYYAYNSGDTINTNKLGTLIQSKNTFSEIQKKLGGMTGILGTMYASLLNIGSTVSYPSGSGVAMIGDVIFKLFFLLALIIPLFTLAVILIVRAVFLWMFIVVSPIIFLFTPIKNFEKVLGEKGKLTNLVSLIFLPVVVVFALSLSFVFLSYLKFEKTSISDTFGVNLTGSKAIIPLDGKDGQHKITISYKGNDSASLFANMGNTFAWLIENIFAIAFMWIIVFSAFKTSKLTSGIASSINKFSLSMAKAAPVAPFAGGQSISSLGQGISQGKALPGKRQSDQYTQKLKPLIDELQSKMAGSEQENIDNANKTMVAPTTKIAGGTSVASYGNKVNNFKSTSLPKGTVGELLKNNEEFSKLATKLQINETTLRDILGKQDYKDKNLKDIFSDLKDKLKDVFKNASKKKLKDIINNNVLSKNITLLQLDDDAKNKIKSFFNQLGIIVSVIGQNEESVKALKVLGFEKKDVIQLLSDNLDGTKSNMKKEDKEKIRNWYNEKKENNSD